jgi:hypothetical protein
MNARPETILIYEANLMNALLWNFFLPQTTIIALFFFSGDRTK